MIELIKGNCIEWLDLIMAKYEDENIIIVTDPPFNIKYKYNTYKDDLEEKEYLFMLKKVLKNKKKRGYSLSRAII